MTTFFSTALFALCLSTLGACGGGGAAINNDAKVDFTLSADEWHAITRDKANIKTYGGKVIQISGKVKKTHSIGSGGDTSQGEHYVEFATANGFSDVSCFFSTAQDALKDKDATLKCKALVDGSYSALTECSVVK